MDWIELKLTVAADDFELVGDIVTMAAPYGYYAEDYRDLVNEVKSIANIDLIDEELLGKDASKCVFHIYLSESDSPTEITAFLTERLRAAGVAYELDDLAAKSEDWADGWKKYFKTTPVGERLLIKPSWEREPEDKDGREMIILDPGAAFGTGTHETTRLCLEALEKIVKKGDKTLDIGCGSGILSVASVKLGASTAVGVDIDPLAVKAARDNADKNGCPEPIVTVIEGDLTDKVEGRYDLVLANIAADAVIALTPGIRRFMNEGAYYLASGIIDSRVDEVKKVLADNGFDIVKTDTMGVWTCFTVR